MQYAEQAMAIADTGAQQLAAAEAQPEPAVDRLPLGVFALTKEEGENRTGSSSSRSARTG